MPFGETKVYFDGSHYIAIPHSTRPFKKRPYKPEETITVVQDEVRDSAENVEPSISLNNEENIEEIENVEVVETETKNKETKPPKVRQLTKKELFNELYSKYIDYKKKERKKLIIQDMLPYFENKQLCVSFVNTNFERKQRNLICRRVRMCRKANLANFNYFCTFTYDDQLHTEETFKKKLQSCFKMMCHRKGWKYMGVWERAPNTNRLHFHGLFNIPKGKMIGELIQVEDYDTKAHRMQTSFQSTYFNERFGRSDFKEIDENERRLGNALAYLMKYIEKTGEKIVYSKGLPQYF
ncbi:MAG: hypothetical protein ACI4PF_01850, partial [Christensenellales bacterium]